MIVEDSEKDAALIAHELKGAGYQVSFERVDTPDSFTASVAEGTWDVILCDNTMPHFSGSEAFELFKRSGRDTPFIYVSGTLAQDAAIAALKAGAQDYIIKSNLNGLVGAVEREITEAVARRKAREELQGMLEELRQMNEELRASQQAVATERRRYLQLFDAAADPYLVTDLEGCIQHANRAAMTALNVPLSSITGHPLALFIAEEERAPFMDYLVRARTGGERYRWHSRIQPREHSAFHASITVAAIKDAPDRLLWILRDTSDPVEPEAMRSSGNVPEAKFPSRTTELQTIIQSLGAAVNEFRVREKNTKNYLNRLTSLRDITDAVTSTLDLRVVLNLLLEKIDLLLPYAATTVHLFNEETGELERFAARNIDESQWRNNSMAVPPSRARIILERKAPLIIRNIQTTPDIAPRGVARREELISYLGLPLIAHGGMVGVIAFYTREEHDFSQEEVEFLSALAGHAAVAIYNARLHEQIRKQASAMEKANDELRTRARQQATVAQFGQWALAEADLNALMTEAAACVCRTLHTDYCGIFEFRRDEKDLLLRAGTGWKQGYVGSTRVVVDTVAPEGYALLCCNPVVFENLLSETRFRTSSLLSYHGVVGGILNIVPGKEGPFGIIGAYSRSDPRFSQDDVNFLQAIATILAAAIKRAQAEEVSLRLAAIVESTEDAIIGRDSNGIVTSWNKGAEKIFGYTAGEMLGRSFFILIPPSDSDRVRRNGERIKRGELVSHYETVRIAKEGKLVDVWITVSPVRDAIGKIIGASTIARDISERKRLEREILEISSKERQRLGQDLHDGLGQQLTGIALMSKVLEEKLKEKSLPEAERVTRIMGHVNDAINLTRALAKGLVPMEVEGQGLISALAALAATSEKLFGITCVLHCDLSVVITDKIVATHLYRIAQEAIDNSVKHGSAQHVSIQLNRFDGRAVLSVTDDGSGFSPNDNRTHGIGLRTMRYRAEMIEGSFEINRGQDGGTVVTCSFPLPGVHT